MGDHHSRPGGGRCGHCKSMAPAWNELMEEYDGHASALVAKVDCTAGGKDLCTVP